MLDLRPEDIIHKSYLNRLLIEIIDRPVLSQNLAFKGGTSAAMRGYLDRFSIDLDFDVLKNANEKACDKLITCQLSSTSHQPISQMSKILRFTNRQVMNHIDHVLGTILLHLNTNSPSLQG